MNRGLTGRYAQLGFFLAAVLVITAGIAGEAAAQKVRKSKSGICHCPGGQYYDRTSKYTAFDTIDACLASSGRPPKRGQGDCSAAPPDDDPATTHTTPPSDNSTTMLQSGRYDRSAFGEWSDDDEDCQNMRHERLIALSTGPVNLSEDGCRVVRGRWNDPYTGTIHTSARDLDIDHLVPLFYAWKRGADRWESGKRWRFMNDSANLLAVEATVNRTKGPAGPLEWLPPASGFHCQYLLRFARVVVLYDLTLSPEEDAAMEQLTAEKCD